MSKETDKQKPKMGQPLKWQSVDILQKQIDDYFAECDSSEKPYTITGLALALDTTRKTLIEYEDRPDYVNAIKRAKTKVENYAEQRLYSGSAAGPIFALKNFDWSDKTQQELTGANGGAIKTEGSITDLDRQMLATYISQQKK